MAKKKLKKFLTDTSAVPAATGYSTEEHSKAYENIASNGTQWTSIYIRKEFLRRFFCDTVQMAVTIAQCTSPNHALFLLSQQFGARGIKTNLTVIAAMLRDRGAFDDTRVMAEEVASLAMRWLEKFDRVFGSTIPNRCGCEIGGKTPDFDYNDLIDDLQKFYVEFHKDVQDCKINDYIGMPSHTARVRKVLSDPKAAKLDALKKLIKLTGQKGGKARIVCRNCSSIGDLVIALEQPPSWALLHIDSSFDELCRCLDKGHEKVPSMLATSSVSLDPRRAGQQSPDA